MKRYSKNTILLLIKMVDRNLFWMVLYVQNVRGGGENEEF